MTGRLASLEFWKIRNERNLNVVIVYRGFKKQEKP
jgi:hypothetical protein